MTNKKYAIVNTIDCPQPRLVTQVIDGKHYYMMRSVKGEEYLKQYDGMTPDRPTFLEDFGFKIDEKGSYVWFEQTEPSKATYEDGKPREWQDIKLFTLPRVILT